MPIFKRRDQERAENYRGVSLLCTVYKVCAEILKKKLEKDIDRLEMLPESQGGFRRGRNTLENIFIVNHLVQRKKREGEKKVHAFFVDLKAAFDNIWRKKL